MNQSRLSRDQVFDLLRNVRRRYALHYLRRVNHTVNLSDLTDHVAAWEYETPPEELASKQRKRVYISLYQTHLPALADAGIVDYDRDTGKIQPTRRIRLFDSYLGAFTKPTRPWYRYYFGLALGSVLVLGGIWAEIVLLAHFSWGTAVLGILTLYGIVAVSHYCYTQNTVPETPPELGIVEDQ
ncbi:DUF7344 domain-containing protein [Haladaptatus salinisoli]|uniref:DUF7344 domain-containing protein n=1 Tax=Haladaptatus salinisoli TaxID=2884876 RepID=UPI003F644F2C